MQSVEVGWGEKEAAPTATLACTNPSTNLSGAAAIGTLVFKGQEGVDAMQREWIEVTDSTKEQIVSYQIQPYCTYV